MEEEFVPFTDHASASRVRSQSRGESESEMHAKRFLDFLLLFASLLERKRNEKEKKEKVNGSDSS
jgi:hypothetical protein